MPELPDVEVFRLLVEKNCLKRTIAKVQLNDLSMLKEIQPKELDSQLSGSSIKETKRHGKHLFIGLDTSKWLELHFGMTGFLQFFPDSQGDTQHDRLRLDFKDSSHLVYDCQRKLGEIGLVQDPERFIQDRGLGPDPYQASLEQDRFVNLISGRRGSIKSALMNQTLLSGLGNIYTDEVLLVAGIHPKTKVKSLRRQDLIMIYKAMQQVLVEAVKREADPQKMSDFLLSQRGKGGLCPHCRSTVEKVTISGRSAYFCPRCQR